MTKEFDEKLKMYKTAIVKNINTHRDGEIVRLVELINNTIFKVKNTRKEIYTIHKNNLRNYVL